MAFFVRVVHRQGWDVEVLQRGEIVEVKAAKSREEGLDQARSLSPDWIEVGDIVGLDTPDQHHVWTTLRRKADGSYEPSPLKWQPKGSS